MDQKIVRNLALAYDADAERRNKGELQSWRMHVVRRLLERLAPGSRVLDAGCGTGQVGAFIASEGFKVEGVDVSASNVKCANARGLSASVGSFHDLPHDTGHFDGVLSFNSLLHVPKVDLEGVMAELRRVASDGAWMLMAVWGGEDREGLYPDDRIDPARFFSLYTDRAFLELSWDGWERVETSFLHQVPDPPEDLYPQVALLRSYP